MLKTQRLSSDQKEAAAANFDGASFLLDAVAAASGSRATRRRAAANLRRLRELQQQQQQQLASVKSSCTVEKQASGALVSEDRQPYDGQTTFADENKPQVGKDSAASTLPEADDEQKSIARQRQNRNQRHLSAGDKEASEPMKRDADARGQQQQQQQVDRSAEQMKSDENEKRETEKQQQQLVDDQKKEFKAPLVWTNIILFVILHSSLPIGIYMLYTQRPWLTLAYSVVGIYISGLGVTGGAHRLWSHRSYRASLLVQWTLVALQTMAGQNSVYTWSRDHRLHHKFAETDADPHNIKRGFFFAHMGWLCCRKHPDVKEKGKLIDMSDLEANKVVMFQHRHFWWMSVMFTVLLPTIIPVLLWGERFWTSFVFSFMIRYMITLHGTWLVNSAAHYYGTRPYDVAIEARESPYAIFNGLGEGFHNYHHTFPYDYATSEFGRYFNITTAFIDLCAALGLVTGRRKVDTTTIIKRRLRTGDLTEEDLKRIEDEQQQVGRESCKASNNAELGDACDEHVNDSDLDSQRDLQSTSRSNPLLSNLIHELPYISGLTSMKYTM